MIKYNLIALILLLQLITGPAISQHNFSAMPDPASFIRSFNEASSRITTIESNFTQEKNLSLLTEKVISKGKFYFKKENLLRWEYTAPYAYLIIFRDSRVLIRDNEKESTIDTRENKVFSEINSIILGSVKGTLFSDAKRFSPAFFESPSQYLVRLTPLSPQLKEYLSEIRIFFDRKDMTVTMLEMQELSGDYTRISFENKKINATIPDEKFTF